jgi:branched-chain amino acid transport system ATP-binding protein
MLSVDHLEVRYGGIFAVRDVSFDLALGECLALIGANGAGKSSTLRAISGLAPVTGGRVVLDGVEISGRPAHEIARLGIGHVPEGRHVFGPLTVEDNLLLGRQRLGAMSASDALSFVFDLLPVLKERRRQLAGSLSGGEQQMLVIGRALVGQPRVLMLDEPSMGLAPLIVDLVFEVLSGLRKSGQTIILVEQNANIALQFASRCILLNLGEIALEGLSEELRQSSDLVDAYLGGK